MVSVLNARMGCFVQSNIEFEGIHPIEEKQQKLGAWFGNNDAHGVAAALPEYVKALQAENPSIKSWAILGVSLPIKISLG